MKKKKNFKFKNKKIRLCIFKSNKHMYIQVINDKFGITLFSCSTINKYIINNFKNINKNKIGFFIGLQLYKYIFFNNIKFIFIDINKNKFSGKIKEIILTINNKL